MTTIWTPDTYTTTFLFPDVRERGCKWEFKCMHVSNIIASTRMTIIIREVK
jgi:hypothetical protein